MSENADRINFQKLVMQQYKECALSPVYFMKKYVKIQHVERGTILFNLYPFQEETLQCFHDYRNTIILKSRQMGISTLVAAYILWLMVFHKDQNILIISLKQEDAMDVLSKITFAAENLPSWMQCKCVENNKKSVKFSNGSQVRASATTKKSGVGKSLNLLVIDECALIDGAEELWASAAPTLSTGGKAVILSTPRGMGSFFHKMWLGAEETSGGSKVGKNGFHAVKLPWHLHPERDEEWRRVEGEKQINSKEAAREFDCDFSTSGDNIIDQVTIEWFKDNRKKEPIEIRGSDKGLWIWEYPDYSKNYIISADCSRGDGTDYSACHVLDENTLEQCAEYKGLVDTKDYGNFLVTLATEYNNAILIIERESVGWAVIQAVVDRNYSNLFYSSSDFKYVDIHQQIKHNRGEFDKKLVPGFSTNVKTRQLIVNKLVECVEGERKNESGIKIHSSRTLSELETFIWDKGKAQAMRGFNDDLCMSLGIGLWVRDTALKIRQEGLSLTKSSLDNMTVRKQDTNPIYKSKMSETGYRSWTMPINSGGVSRKINVGGDEDIRWLL